MPLKLTKEQIVQLAPDEASVKAAKGLQPLPSGVSGNSATDASGGIAKAAAKIHTRLRLTLPI